MTRNKLILIYLVLSFIWIFSTDFLVTYFIADITDLFTYGVVKGTFFIIVTSIFFLLIIRSKEETIHTKEEEITSIQTNLNQVQTGLEYIIENAPIIFWIIDPSGNFLYVGGRALSEIGLTKDELEGANLFTVFENDEILVDKAKSVLSNTPEFWVHQLDDRILEAHYYPYILNDQTYGLGISYDVTDRERYYDELTQARNVIVKSHKYSILGETSAKIVHDLNNYVTVIKGYISLIHKTTENEVIMNYLDKMQSISDAIAFLPNSLLDLLRDNKGTNTIDLVKVLTNKEHIFKSILDPNIVMELRIDPSSAVVNISESELIQVLMNLILNARDAISEKGKIEIILRERPEENGAFILSVIDDGPGIEETKIPHIFEDLYTDKVQGTGLGLTIVKDLVEGWNADIQVESKTGRTEFRIAFDRTNNPA